MATTIQVSEELAEELKSKKMYDKESYEEVIWDLIEDTKELSEEAKKMIKQAEREFIEGKFHTLDEVERRYR